MVLAGILLLLGAYIAQLAIRGALITEIHAGGIVIHFRGVPVKRFIPWNEIASVEARKYRPILEYGGWGLRGLGKNRAYNVSGTEGLQLVFKDGRRVLVGSRMAQALEEAARKAMQECSS